MRQQKQQKINSILNQVRKGEIEVQIPDYYYKVECVKEEELQFLRASLLDYGQIDPIYVVIEDLFSNNPIVKIVSGYKRLFLINQLRKEGKWDKGLYVKLYKDNESDTKSPAGFFANSNFARTNHTTMQKGIFAGVMLCPGLRAQGKANQAGHEQVTVRVNTIVDAGKKVNINEHAVSLGEKLATLDKWFYTYIWEEQNDMPTSDVKALLKKKSDPSEQRTIVEKMKEIYEEDKARELKNKSKSKIKTRKIQNDPLDDLFTPEEKAEDALLNSDWEEPRTTLYKRALSKVATAKLIANPATAGNKVASINGKDLPDEDQIQVEINDQQVNGKDAQARIVPQYGNGKKRMTVEFLLTEVLAENLVIVCKQHGIDITIFSILNSEMDTELEVAA